MIVEYDQIRLDLAAMEKPIDELGIALDIEGAKETVKKLEQETLAPDFYNDTKNSQKVLQKIKEQSTKIERFNTLHTDWEDLSTLVEMAIEEDDESLLEEIQTGFDALTENLENISDIMRQRVIELKNELERQTKKEERKTLNGKDNFIIMKNY